MDPKTTALIVIDMNRAHLDPELKYLPVSDADADRVLENTSSFALN